MIRSDADRFELLDRLRERVPELDLEENAIEWTTLPDGHAALLVNGGGIDGGDGTFFANAGEDLHAVGSVDPLVPGNVGCIVIRPNGSRYLARMEPDPLSTSGIEAARPPGRRQNRLRPVPSFATWAGRGRRSP